MAIVTLDTVHNIVSCNPAFEQLYGYSQQEVVGRNLDEYDRYEVSEDVVQLDVSLHLSVGNQDI